MQVWNWGSRGQVGHNPQAPSFPIPHSHPSSPLSSSSHCHYHPYPHHHHHPHHPHHHHHHTIIITLITIIVIIFTLSPSPLLSLSSSSSPSSEVILFTIIMVATSFSKHHLCAMSCARFFMFNITNLQVNVISILQKKEVGVQKG